MTSRFLPIFAWLLLAAVAVVTIAPIGFRPVTFLSANAERFLTFGLVGFAFALAYPRHLALIVLVVLAAAVGFELLQALQSTRHARLPDMGIKLIGGGVGIATGLLANRLWHRVAARRAG